MSWLPVVIWSPTNGVSIEDFCTMPMLSGTFGHKLTGRRTRRQRRSWNRAVREWKLVIGRKHRVELRLDPFRDGEDGIPF